MTEYLQALELILASARTARVWDSHPELIQCISIPSLKLTNLPNQSGPRATGYKLPPYNEWVEIRKTFEELNIRP